MRLTRKKAEGFLQDLGRLLKKYEMELEVEVETIGYNGYFIELNATDQYGDGWELGTWVTPDDCTPNKVTQVGVFHE